MLQDEIDDEVKEVWPNRLSWPSSTINDKHVPTGTKEGLIAAE